MTLTVLGIDPRCLVTSKLPAPAPLPHVSRRALRRVRDRIAIPTACDCCGGPVKLTNNRDVYNGVSYGEWPYVYRCPQCQAYVGLHPDTDLPLGTMADRDTREARKVAKTAFLKVSAKRFHRDRGTSYAWLAAALEIDPRTCHFAMFTAELCRRVEIVCQEVRA